MRSAETASRNEAIAASLPSSPAVRGLAERRRAVLDLLGFEDDRDAICQDRYGADLVRVRHRLMKLGDAEVMQVMALVMAETLAIGSEAVAYLGEHLAIAMAGRWQVDKAFFALLRDKEVLLAILREVGGGAVADAHASEKGATLKRLIADHLTGANERPRAERWVPSWMAFPPAVYTERGGVAMVAAAQRAKWLVERADGEARAADSVEPSPVEAPDSQREEPVAA